MYFLFLTRVLIFYLFIFGKGITYSAMSLAKHVKTFRMTENLMRKSNERSAETGAPMRCCLRIPEAGSTALCVCCGQTTRVGSSTRFHCSNSRCGYQDSRDVKSARFILGTALAICLSKQQAKDARPRNAPRAGSHGDAV